MIIYLNLGRSGPEMSYFDVIGVSHIPSWYTWLSGWQWHFLQALLCAAGIRGQLREGKRGNKREKRRFPYICPWVNLFYNLSVKEQVIFCHLLFCITQYNFNWNEQKENLRIIPQSFLSLSIYMTIWGVKEWDFSSFRFSLLHLRWEFPAPPGLLLRSIQDRSFCQVVEMTFCMTR